MRSIRSAPPIFRTTSVRRRPTFPVAGCMQAYIPTENKICKAPTLPMKKPTVFSMSSNECVLIDISSRREGAGELLRTSRKIWLRKCTWDRAA